MRVRYFLSGKPGVGKTVLAEKLSSTLQSVKILTDSAWTSVLQDQLSQDYSHVFIGFYKIIDFSNSN